MIDRLIAWSQRVADRLIARFGDVDVMTFPELAGRIRRIIEAPQANPLQTLMLVAIVLLLILSIVIFIVLLVMNFRRADKYSFVDTEGEEQTIERPKQDELLERLKEEGISEEDLEDGLVVKRRFFVYKVALAVVAVLIAWVVFGATTSARGMCIACHAAEDHIAYMKSVDHPDVSCVYCHETGGGFERHTSNVLPRALHLLSGVTGNSGGLYASVSQSSCLKCHNTKLDSATVSSRTYLRVSHKEPIEANMSCLRCHLFSETQEVSFKDMGMAVCIQCHSGERASAECTTCHTKPASARNRGAGQENQEILITAAPQERCYDCHNPRPCDNCHGLRIPHPENFAGRAHVAERNRLGTARCQKCHHKDSPTGIMPCTDCHSL